jgi:hypothetical protein
MTTKIDTSKITDEQLQKYKKNDEVTVLIDLVGNVEVRRDGDVVERGHIETEQSVESGGEPR